MRLALLLLLLGRCQGDPAALASVGGAGMVADLLGDPDPRLAYHAACFLQVPGCVAVQQSCSGTLLRKLSSRST